MPRAQRIYSDKFPYHITARCINRNWFKIPTHEVWEIFSRHLFFVHHGLKGRIHAFVLMDNHFHLLISTPEGNIDQIMWYLMKSVSQEITQRSRRINQTFGGPYFSCLIKSDHNFMHAYKYVYRNPLEANIVRYAEDYRYSTLNGLLGRSHLLFPVEPDHILFGDTEETLRWLNHQYKNDDKESIQLALKKKTFTLPRDRDSRRPSRLEKELS